MKHACPHAWQKAAELLKTVYPKLTVDNRRDMAVVGELFSSFREAIQEAIALHAATGSPCRVLSQHIAEAIHGP